MPTYEYACTSCDHQFEIVQSIHDDALTACPECGSPLRKVFGSVGIVFKGSGFYKTDSRGSSSSSKSTSAGSSSSSESTSTSTDKPAAKPAEKPASSTPASSSD